MIMTDTTKSILKALALIVAIYFAAKVAWFLTPLIVISLGGYWVWSKYFKKPKG